MKIAMTFLALTLSMNVFAASMEDSTVATSALPYATTGLSYTAAAKVQAVVILNDAQEAMQSGKVSAFLGQKIKETQAQDSSLSELEAIEVLISGAQNLLN